jgi:hypothetical protein
MALLEKITQLNKELELTELHDRSKDEQIEYVETQIKEIKAIMHRLRCDILLNSVIEVSSDDEREAQETNVKAYKKDLKRMGQAVTVYNELLEELKA